MKRSTKKEVRILRTAIKKMREEGKTFWEISQETGKPPQLIGYHLQQMKLDKDE